MATLTLEPNGVGDETAIPNLVGAATHWQAVLTSDGDTSYVETPNDDPDYHRDLYAFGDSSDLGTIASITIKIIGRILQPDWTKTSLCVKWSLKTHGTVYDEQGVMPANIYGFAFSGTEGIWTTNPYTGNAWTWDEINALQVGANLHRSHKFVPDGYYAARVTQVYVVVTYTPIVAPTVTTNPATEVEATTATGNGNITDNGGEDCDKRGFVYNTSPHGDPGDTAPADSEYSNYVEETGSFGTGAFTGALTSLEPKTTYYIRAYAHNSAGYSYGDEVSFTTLVAIGEVTTDEATNVKETSATLNGTLDDDGGEACEVRFQYGLTTDYSGNTDWQPGKETGDTFSQLIVELVGGNLYHFRAQAKNSAGTANGNDRALVTITPFVARRAYALSREEL